MAAKDFKVARARMIKTQIIDRGIRDHNVINALNLVPRDIFVEDALAAKAYSDFPLPIGHRQTISQPYMVALMTESLELKKTDRVLEVGTGSGYQTAVLSMLASWVYTVERIPYLTENAKKILTSNNYLNISYKIANGAEGWKEFAPYDAIIVTAGAPPEIPKPLLQQLKEGGRMIIPTGERKKQLLLKIIKNRKDYMQEVLTECSFVDLIGKHAWMAEEN